MTAPTGYGVFAIGGATFPIVSPGANTPLQDADPTLYFGLDFWAAMIRQHVGARLLAVAAGLGFTGATAWTNSTGAADAVRQQYPYDVGPYLTELQARMPLLAAWRGKTVHQKLTSGLYQDRCDITVAYILPPLSAAQAEQLIPLMRSVQGAIRNRTVQAWDPSYTPPGGNLGDQFDGPAYANVEEIGFEEGEHGWMVDAGNLYFPCVTWRGFVVERDNAVTGAFPPFAGGNIEVDLVSDEGTTVPNLVDAATQQAPTVTLLSVTTGSHTGGTAVTITGTLFLPGPQVFFGPLAAASVVWVSATQITCVTPAVDGFGTLDVTVLNRDGQAGTLPGAFIFT